MNEKEFIIIGRILKDDDKAAEMLRVLSPVHFTDLIARDLFKILQEMHRDEKPLDVVTALSYTDYTPEQRTALVSEIRKGILSADVVHDENITELAAGLINAYSVQAIRDNVNTCDDLDSIIETIDRITQDASTRTAGRNRRYKSAKEYLLSGWNSDTENAKKRGAVKTGINCIDQYMKGLYAGGLYVIGAISSLGKTTLVHQIADNIAGSGTPVLYFSLEMSQHELISKSIVRRTATRRINNNQKTGDILTSIELRNGRTSDETNRSMKEYLQDTAENMHIIEGNFDTNVHTIRADVKRFIKENPDSPAPVVFLDYLQILTSPDKAAAGAKQETDINIKALKMLARDFGTAVFVISSLNRANYETEISFESLKESGLIEYSADCVIGMQLTAVSTMAPRLKSSNNVSERRVYIDSAKAANPRQIMLKFLKNRYAKPNEALYLTYYPHCDYFTDGQTPEAFEEERQAAAERVKNVSCELVELSAGSGRGRPKK